MLQREALLLTGHTGGLQTRTHKPALFCTRACLKPVVRLSRKEAPLLTGHTGGLQTRTHKPALFHTRACLKPVKRLSQREALLLPGHNGGLQVHACTNPALSCKRAHTMQARTSEPSPVPCVRSKSVLRPMQRWGFKHTHICCCSIAKYQGMG